jgi:DnaK suppressor protein
MNTAEIEQLRLKLLHRRAELLEEQESSNKTARPAGLEQVNVGLSSRDALHVQQRAEEGARRRKRQLQKIDGALRRIEAGEYGRCFVCEEELDARRLSEDPTITRCVNCVEE